MNSTILNREFQHPTDGWYQIEAKGQHPNRAAGVVQVIDDAAAETIVNRFNEDATKGALRHGNEMLIDHEHFSDQQDQESRAYGWLQQLQNRDDGIYGRIRWTATGKPAVDGGDYRFFSTEYAPGDLTILNSESGKRKAETTHVRPLRLAGLTLTNMNNNRGQKPITNRDNFASAVAPAANQNQNPKKPTMKTIATKLGLAAEASEDAILAAVTTLQNRVTSAEAEVTPLKNRQTALETENQTLLGEQCAALLDAHGIKAEDKTRREKLLPVLTGLKNREDRLAFLKDCVAVAAAPAQPQRKLFNRETAQPGEQAATGADDKDRAQKIRNRASELKGMAPGRTFESCWSQAQGEIK